MDSRSLCIWEKRNNNIKDPDQKFMLAVLNGRWFANFPCKTRFAQTLHQICCEPFKTTAKFQWFWILYIIISFFSYTRTAIQITTGVYVVRYWLRIFDFVNGRFVSFWAFQTSVCLNFLLNICDTLSYDWQGWLEWLE